MLASLLVYSAQLVWGTWGGFPDVDTAFIQVAGKAGGPWLFGLVSVTLLVAQSRVWHERAPRRGCAATTAAP